MPSGIFLNRTLRNVKQNKIRAKTQRMGAQPNSDTVAWVQAYLSSTNSERDGATIIHTGLNRDDAVII
jgi:hypothetical protein